MAKSKLKKRLVTPDHALGLTERYEDAIECPSCKHEMFAYNTRYCAHCGIRLLISKQVQDWLKKPWG
jgi:ribosomal protein L37E